jgi:hypothetical protein
MGRVTPGRKCSRIWFRGSQNARHSGLECSTGSEIDRTIVTVGITGYATVDSAEAMKKVPTIFLNLSPDEFRSSRRIERRKNAETIALRWERCEDQFIMFLMIEIA